MNRKETIAAIQRRLQNLQENKPEGCEATKAAFKQAIDDINALLELNSKNALEILEREIDKGHTVKLEKSQVGIGLKIWDTRTGEILEWGTTHSLESTINLLGGKNEKPN